MTQKKTEKPVRKKSEKQNMGFGEGDAVDLFREQLENFLRPELINRLDKILVFSQLNQAHLAKIANQQLTELAIRLQRKNIGIFTFDNFRCYLSNAYYSI